MLPRRMINNSFQSRPSTKLKISNKKSKPETSNNNNNNKNDSSNTSTVSKSNDDFRKLLGLK